jgi:hypothetical protein
MKRIFIILVICSICSVSVYSQQENIPYGKRAKIWYDSERQQDSTYLGKRTLKSGAKMGSELNQDSLRLLNFHKTKTFDLEQTSIKMPYEVNSISRLTVIVVYHSSDTLTEHGIWSMYSGKNQISGLTDRRLFRQKSEYEYPVKQRGIPLINTSMQSFSKSRQRMDSNYFVLGETILPDSSVSYYSGDIAEYFVFDKFLKKPEALQIETYLAIKYGITLIASDYVSSSERVIWNYEENEVYSNGIAGIGKDSVSGLNQRQGSSSEEEGILSIGIGNFERINNDNHSVIPEGNYLLWGHNEGIIGNEAVCETEYPLWDRKWLMQVSYTDTNNRIETTIRVHLPEEYWDTTRINCLVIERNEVGDFTSSTVEYIPQSYYDEAGNIYFDKIVWDKDGSGKDIFSFSYGATMKTELRASCPDGQNGELSVSMCGGKLPFTYLLEDSAGQQYEYEGEKEHTFLGLASGIYTLKVTDGKNVMNIQQIEIPALELAELGLPSKYWINPQEVEFVDAKEYSSVDFIKYEWKKDGMIYSDSSIVSISIPGKYKLTVTDSNGCVYSSEMDVEELSSSQTAISEKEGSSSTKGVSYKMYPNPTTGSYKVEVELVEETSVSIRVFTVKGELLATWEDSGKKYYLYESYISVRGNYIIEVETSFEKKDFKLTVVK